MWHCMGEAGWHVTCMGRMLAPEPALDHNVVTLNAPQCDEECEFTFWLTLRHRIPWVCQEAVSGLVGIG